MSIEIHLDTRTVAIIVIALILLSAIFGLLRIARRRSGKGSKAR